MILETVDEALCLEESLARERAEAGMLAFAVYTMPEFEVNWHHRAICRAINYMEAGRTPRELLASWGIKGKKLQAMLDTPHAVTGLYAGMTRPDMIDEPITGLQIHAPPRHGKSQIISRHMPAWWLGKRPDAQVISTSYGSVLAKKMNKDVQRIMDGAPFQAVFPETRLASKTTRAQKEGTWVRKSDLFEIVERRGSYMNAGVGGAITGSGSNLSLCDDPFKNREEAKSLIIRNKVWDWYTSTLFTRSEKDIRHCIINTRWHEDDLSGRSLTLARTDPEAQQWFCLVFPAILDCEPGPGDPRKDGEALWPNKYNLKALRRIRAMGIADFESLYQQRPTAIGGGVVKDTWWQYYSKLPATLTDYTISVDLTFKGGQKNDYCCYQVWACDRADRYLIDMVMKKITFTEQVEHFKMLCARYPEARVKLVEDAANGAALIDTLKRTIGGIIPVEVKGSKEKRAEAVAPQVESGNVYLPIPANAPWVKEFLSQWSAFPNGANDDAVDAASQFLNRMASKTGDLGSGMPKLLKKGASFAREVTPYMGGRREL